MRTLGTVGRVLSKSGTQVGPAALLEGARVTAGAGWGCDPPTAAPPSDAAGRTGRDTCVFSLLWKEAEGCEGASWVPESQALVLASNPWTLLTCGL